MFRVKSSLAKIVKERCTLRVTSRCLHSTPLGMTNWGTKALQLTTEGPLRTCVRNVAFFNKVPGGNLWNSVVGVSNAGKKRGRGKRVGRKRVTDLNRGQKLGMGEANMIWPGLNSPTIKGKQHTTIQKLAPNPNYQQALVTLRQGMSRVSHKAQPALLRGWSGSREPGKSAGPPDPLNDNTFEGFDSRILQLRMVSTVTGTLGKKYTFSCFAVVGNKNGLAGFAQGKSTTAHAAMRIAKNRAAQNLLYIPMYEDHTVYHNIYSQFHRSKIMVHKRRKGYGLVAHRAIKTVCEQIGIKDLHVKVEGSTKNIQAVVKGFFQALLSQETHQELADRMKLHVVETRPERNNLPTVIASPGPGQEVREEPVKTDCPEMDKHLKWLYYGDKHEYERRPKVPFYCNTHSYRSKKTWEHKVRNQPDAQMLRRAGLW